MNDSKSNNTIKWIKDKRTIYLSVCRVCGTTNPHDELYKCSNCNRGVEQKERYCPSCGGKYNWMEDEE